MVCIRRFDIRDIEAVTALMGELGYPATVQQMSERMEKIGSNSMNCTIVAEIDGEVVGMIRLRLLHNYESDGRWYKYLD